MRTVADFKAAMDRSDVNYEIDQLTPEHERDAASTLWPDGTCQQERDTWFWTLDTNLFSPNVDGQRCARAQWTPSNNDENPGL